MLELSERFTRGISILKEDIKEANEVELREDEWGWKWSGEGIFTDLAWKACG